MRHTLTLHCETTLEPQHRSARLLRVPRLGRYAAVGVVNTTLSTMLFLVLQATGLDVSVADAIAFLAGATTSYVLNRAWTFQDGERGVRTTTWRFAVVTLVGLVSTAIVVRIAVDDAHLSPLPAQLATVVLVTGVTYLLSHRWAFAVR